MEVDKLNAVEQGLIFEIAKRDPYTFIVNYCSTVDEHGVGSRVKLYPRVQNIYVCNQCKVSYPIDFDPMNTPFAWREKGVLKVIEFKPCPRCGRELQIPWGYLKAIIDIWKITRKFLCPKSRQMLLSWTMVCCHLWEDIVAPNTLSMWQSKTEDKAKELIKRAGDVHSHFPQFIVDMESYGALKRPPSQLEYWFVNGSRVKAVPKGPEQATSFTCSSFLSDEMAYQEEAAAAYAEVVPTLGGIGRFTGISTLNGEEFFWRLINDKKEGEV